MAKYDIEYIPVDKIKIDEDNPNRMTRAEKKSLTENIKKYGFLVPLILNKEYMIIDGHQRFEVVVDLKYKEVMSIVIDVENVDRLMLQQIMNKLKGQHLITKDILVFEMIKKQAGSFKELSKLLAQKEKYFEDILNMKDIEIEQYLLVREVDEDLKKEEITNVKQLKLVLTDEQKVKIKEKFGDTKKLLEIVDYFLQVE